MRCMYCGSSTTEGDRNCVNCGAPAVSFLGDIRKKLHSEKSEAKSVHIKDELCNKITDYAALNSQRNHLISREIVLPKAPLRAGEKIGIVILVLFIIGMFFN